MRCDCLNDCGDDPQLRDGRAQPCERLQKERAAAAKAKEDARQLKHCAIAVSDWLQGGCDVNDIPRPHIAALVAFTKAATERA
jgi:hypothetical protein